MNVPTYEDIERGSTVDKVLGRCYSSREYLREVLKNSAFEREVVKPVKIVLPDCSFLIAIGLVRDVMKYEVGLTRDEEALK